MTEHLDELELELARTGEAPDDVRNHLESCAECRDRLAAHEALAARISRPLEPVDVPPQVDEKLLQLARDSAESVRRQLRPGGRVLTFRRVIPWAAAASVVAALGAWLLLRQHAASTPQIDAGPQVALAAPPSVPPAPPAEPDVPSPPAEVAVAPAGPDDRNADGRVDVIDAYLAALSDDRRDADRIAMAVVTLSGPAGGNHR